MTEFNIHRVKTLPTGRLKNGDNYELEKPNNRHQTYIVKPDGTLSLLMGITEDEQSRLERLSSEQISKMESLTTGDITKLKQDYTKAEIDTKISDLGNLATSSKINLGDSTVLPVPPQSGGVTIPNAWVELAQNVTYTQAGGSPITGIEGHRSIAEWDNENEVWSLVDMGELPQVEVVQEVQEGVTSAVSSDGTFKAITPIDKRTKGFDSTSTSEEYIEIAASAMGKVYRKVNSNHEHTIKLTGESDVPSEAIKDVDVKPVKQIQITSADGVYIGYSDGKVRRIDNVNTPDANKVYTEHISPLSNVCYSEWVSPLFVEIPSKDLLAGSPVKRGLPPIDIYPKVLGNVWSLHSKFKQDWNAKELMPILHAGPQTNPIYRTWTVDDHNAGCTLVDLRPDATKPIMVVQNDHGSPFKPRIASLDWSGEVLSIVDLPVTEGTVTYGQISRNPNNPNQIYYMYREGGTSFATWSIARSMDNGDTWMKVTLFGDGTGSDYLLSREAFDMSGIHIIGCMHPITGNIQNVVYCHLSWDGTLSDNVNGVHIEDIFSQDNNYNMFLEGNSRLLRIPASNKRTRLHDFFETSEGIIEVIISEFLHSTDYSGASRGQEYRYLKFDINDTGVIYDVAIMPAGWPQEVPAGANDYFCGGTVISENTLILSRWDTSSIATHNEHIGKGSLFKCVYDNEEWNITLLKEIDNNKIIRPKVGVSFRIDENGKQRVTLGEYYYVLEGEYYDFDNWNTKLLTFKK